MKIAFDIETDGLDPTKIHCIAAKVIGLHQPCEFWGPDTVKFFPAWLIEIEADTLVGHNIIGYDLPAMSKLLGFNWDGDIEDTLVMSRLSNPSREGGHSLANWGRIMNFPKGDYDDWENYSEEMKEYCIQDVEVTTRVYNQLTKENISKAALKLEHKIYKITQEQTKNGWKFNTKKATSLLAELKQEMFNAEDDVREVFVPLATFKKLSFPKTAYKKDGTISASFQRQLDKKVYLDEELGWGIDTYPPFNLGSRPQIARYLQHFGWEPTDFTEKETVMVSESILEKVEIPEAQLIAKYLMLQKRLGMVSSWIEAVTDEDRIHGSVNTCGAVTGRMTHSKPNLAQVPAGYSPYGKECRELFTVEEGYRLVGADASGLELRMLAHYMDDNDYTNEVVNGDIHTRNQENAGLKSRDEAKTFIYAFLYGAGDGKIGEIVGGSVKEGRKLKADFLDNTPALSSLRKRVVQDSSEGRIMGLDGRQLHIRSSHAALNTLLQSAGAIVMKRAVVLLDKFAKEYNINYRLVGQIHDEVQAEVQESQADFFGSLAVDCIKKAGIDFKLNCPLDGAYQVGTTWKETH